MTLEEHVAAAYACDHEGREDEAVAHYDAAFRLGGPRHDRAGFLLGYGSTLRNVGRVDEAIHVLSDAIAAFPGDHALRAFLALALHSAGRHAAAVATLLDVIVDLAPASPPLARYARALGEYRDALT